MKKVMKYLRNAGAAVYVTLMAATMVTGVAGAANASDSLYISDASDNTVKEYDAATGAFKGTFMNSQGGVHLPTGIIFDSAGNLLLSNQNADTGVSGEILRYDKKGKLLDQLVKSNTANAPFAPQGLLFASDTIFVASVVSSGGGNSKAPQTPGDVRQYDSTGRFLRSLVPSAGLAAVFHPRAMVVGPDGLLYVSSLPNLLQPDGSGLGGQVLRFNMDGTFKDVFISSVGGNGQLNRPEGLVFDGSGNLYVTSFSAIFVDPATGARTIQDTDKIMIYNTAGVLTDHIDLDALDSTGNLPPQSRTYAQALIFGPNGHLFVPITPTGEVRRYDVTTKSKDVFIAAGGALKNPWFPIFGKTKSDTLSYHP